MYGRSLRVVAAIAMFCSMAPAQSHPLVAATNGNRAHAACPHARANAAHWAKSAPAATAPTTVSKAPIQVSAGGISAFNVRRFVPELLP